ncbi:MAG: PspC domain-containing protein [Actinomycetota bacterium]|jgi:phage shock protein C|nr:PspC domain-containing protein [Actinomycetota bacterium]
MSENPGNGPVHDPDSARTGIVIAGAALIMVGLWSLGSTFVGPWVQRAMTPFGIHFSRIKDMGWPVGLVMIGVLLIIWTQHPGFTPPAKGARIHRSRSKKVISGVLGGLADYLNMDVALIRLGYVAVAMLFGFWPAVVAYVVATIVMPEEG